MFDLGDPLDIGASLDIGGAFDLGTPTGGGGGWPELSYTPTGSPSLFVVANDIEDANDEVVTSWPARIGDDLSLTGGSPIVTEALNGHRFLQCPIEGTDWVEFPATYHNPGTWIAVARRTLDTQAAWKRVVNAHGSGGSNIYNFGTPQSAGDNYMGLWRQGTYLKATSFGWTTLNEWYVAGWNHSGTSTLTLSEHLNSSTENETINPADGLAAFEQYRLGGGTDIAALVIWPVDLGNAATLAEMAALAADYGITV